ncbi:MAG: NAD(P)/FAD-dependent oxidoreductase [Deltaproteobacteria bacterium]|nr:NAD(P)/FAD-dependent oxidoreductase [Candidatus Zymogenaceae bacterium]
MKAVVIGSGISGLVVGLSLVRDGYEVELFEQYKTLGGVTDTLEEGGYKWDIGPMLVEAMEPDERAGRVLADLGVLDKIEIIRDQRGYIFPDYDIVKPEKYSGAFWRKEHMMKLFPEEKKGLERYYRDYIRFCEIVTLFFDSERRRGLSALIAKARMLLKLLPIWGYQKMSAQDLMDRHFTSEKLKAIFMTILADFVVRPSEFPALGVFAVNPEPAWDRELSLEVSRVGRQASYTYIKGGIGTLVDAMVDAIREAGGKIHAGVAVEEILVEEGRAKGVLTEDGRNVPADVVVASGGAHETFKKLVGEENLPEKFKEDLDGLELMESVFMVHLGVELDPREYQQEATVYYYQTYDIEGAIKEAQEGHYHEGKDGFVVYIPSMHSPEMAPPGHHAMTIYTIAPDVITNGDWTKDRERFYNSLLEEAERVFPDLRKKVKVKVIMTPEDFRKITHLDHHAFGGLKPVLGKTGQSFKTPVKGLWFVGQQSESGGGISNVVYGAKKTADAIAKGGKR